MEQATAPPPTQEPATREDVRWLGRWLVVVALWAAAASAVAILALVDTRNQEGDKDRTARLEDQVTQLQRDLVTRTGRLQTRLEGVPQSQDLARLEKRLAKVERESTKASADAKKATAKLTDLEGRIKTLESSSKSSSAAKPKNP
jgi:septal ring factor EnvC (AmiA/AmiB activator)